MNLEPRQRRKVVLLSLLRVVAAWAVVLLAYSFTPDRSFSTGQAVLRLTLDLLVVGLLLAWMTKRIIEARFPVVAAAEALGFISVAFVASFATIYLMLDDPSAPAFTQRLDHVKAMYMTVTVLSTVGFGDIVARTNLARVLVTVQMVLDLILIGAVVRLLFNAARHGLSRDQA